MTMASTARSTATSMARAATSFMPSAYTGMSPAEHMQIRQKNLSPIMVPFYKNPPLFHEAYMQYMYDSRGKKYLDMFAGVCTVSVGHCHPVVTEAVKNQLEKLWHTTHLYLTPPMQEYAMKLTAKLPSELSVAFFANSGSEANDMAISLARMYTGNQNIISLRNGYHGLSTSLMGLSGMNTWNHNVVTHNVHQANRDCDCSSTDECKASENYVNQLNDLLSCSLPKNGTAAIIMEGIQGGGGIVQFPKSYTKKAVQMIRAQGGLYIADEVQTGFGRTGDHFWGFEMQGVQPDIVTMAKGTANGFPLSAVVTTPEIAAVLAKAIFFNTFGGNPLACTAGSAVLDVIESEGMQENCRTTGSYLLKKLSELRDEFEIVGDVRGKGLMIGIEMVEDKVSKKPLAMEKMGDIHETTMESGLLIGRGGLHKSIFRFQPPMCITKDDADFTVDILRKAIKTNS